MQTSKLRSVLTATNARSNIIRNVAAQAAAVNEGEDVNEGKPYDEIPGPSSLPLIGPLHHFIPGGKFYKTPTQEFMKKARELYGPIVRLDGMLGRPPMLMLLDAESSAQVLRGENWLPYRPGFQSLEYYRSTYKFNNKKTDKPTGLITDHGDQWKRFRSTVNPVMLQPKTVKLYSSALDEVAKDMIKRIKSVRGEDNMITTKFDVEMNLWALESIGIVALGGRLNCFDPNLPEDAPARQLINVVHDIFEIAEKIDFQPNLWRYFATPTFKKAMHAHLFGARKAANTMVYNLYQLAKNPEKQDKLRAELQSGSQDRPYLKACTKEAMRLMPVVAGNLRMATKDYNIMGYKVPKGIHITFIHQEMAKNEEHYKNANEFIPERWIVPKDDPLYHGNAHPFAYSPFGFGARMCIGRRIAELEIQTFLAQFIQNFKVEWVGPPLKITETSLNYATGPFNFVLRDV